MGAHWVKRFSSETRGQRFKTLIDKIELLSTDCNWAKNRCKKKETGNSQSFYFENNHDPCQMKKPQENSGLDSTWSKRKCTPDNYPTFQIFQSGRLLSKHVDMWTLPWQHISQFSWNLTTVFRYILSSSRDSYFTLTSKCWGWGWHSVKKKVFFAWSCFQFFNNNLSSRWNICVNEMVPWLLLWR